MIELELPDYLRRLSLEDKRRIFEITIKAVYEKEAALAEQIRLFALDESTPQFLDDALHHYSCFVTILHALSGNDGWLFGDYSLIERILEENDRRITEHGNRAAVALGHPEWVAEAKAAHPATSATVRARAGNKTKGRLPPKLPEAIETARRDLGRPGTDGHWTPFCNSVRQLCGANPKTRGYSDRNIRRHAMAIWAKNAEDA